MSDPSPSSFSLVVPSSAQEISICDIKAPLNANWKVLNPEQKAGTGYDAIWIHPETKRPNAAIMANPLAKSVKEEADEMTTSATLQPEVIKLREDRKVPLKDGGVDARIVSLEIGAGDRRLGIAPPMMFHSVYLPCKNGDAVTFKLTCGKDQFDALKKEFEAAVFGDKKAAAADPAKAFEVPMEAPKGYSWAKCPEIKGGFLKPDGWHFKKQKRGETHGFFITKENIDEESAFTTGLTVNVIPDIPKKKAMTPLAFANQLRAAAKKLAPLDSTWEREMGPRTQADPAGAFTTHNLYIANEKTGTLYMVIFEAPEADWKATWKTAEPMLKFLYIDDTI